MFHNPRVQGGAVRGDPGVLGVHNRGEPGEDGQVEGGRFAGQELPGLPGAVAGGSAVPRVLCDLV